MNNTLEFLKTRQMQLNEAIARDKGRVKTLERELKQVRDAIASSTIRLDEVAHQLRILREAEESENVIHMHRKDANTGKKAGARTKPELRYRNPGPTTDIVRLAYASPGIEVDVLVAKVHGMYEAKGIPMGTISRLVNRMVREGYAYREDTKFYLTQLCKDAWQGSPLFRKAAAHA